MRGFFPGPRVRSGPPDENEGVCTGLYGITFGPVGMIFLRYEPPDLLLRENPVDFLAAFHPIEDNRIIRSYFASDPVVSRPDPVKILTAPHFVDIKILKKHSLMPGPVQKRGLLHGDGTASGLQQDLLRRFFCTCIPSYYSFFNDR